MWNVLKTFFNIHGWKVGNKTRKFNPIRWSNNPFSFLKNIVDNYLTAETFEKNLRKKQILTLWA